MASNFFHELEKSIISWEKSIENPEDYQKRVLGNLIKEYEKTRYGEQFNAEKIQSIDEYRNSFPIIKYNTIIPYLESVKKGDFKAFLSEEPQSWVLTRGTTGKSKVFPITRRHMHEIFECGSRAVLNYSIKSRGSFILDGKVLNLNFPSNVSVLNKDGAKLIYGYSSGTYAKMNPIFKGLSLIPRQEEIDALQTGLTLVDWDKRFELIYEKTRNENIFCIIGVAPVQLSFGRYLKRRHRLYPKDLWKLKVIFSTSVAKIQTKYASLLRSVYGETPIVEMYTATEGAFAQQKDSLPYIVPNYDTYFFEVRTGKGVKMLHEMEKGEWGHLIVSTSILPRYDIGDLIESLGKNYFRVFGRARKRIILEHYLYRAIYRWFL